MPKTESLTVRLSLELRAALTAESEASGETLTEVVERYLTAGLADGEGRRRGRILEADMARVLDGANDIIRAAATEASVRLMQVSTRLTLNHPPDFAPFADPDPDPEDEGGADPEAA